MSGPTARSKNRKTLSAVIATALALAIMLTGTLAWTSISQQALNEVQSGTGPNPGGRLHDDFDGENKDVYVENFGDVPIFARIRLDEYMEIGSGAGLKTGDAGYGEKTAQSLVSGADINDVTTWRTHLPGGSTLMGDSSDPFHDYWDWEFGGSTTYMPTFNKNKDSLEADINGTYDGTNPADDVHFDDYTTYVVGEQKTADAVYDADDNTIDEGAAAVEGVNITTVTETHTAASTLTGTVITMEAWKAMGSPVGPYWVYDVDGWAYWAQPIQPGTATGLLLDAILKTGALEALEEDWYYAINVIGQFATADDIGSADDGTGFFGPDAGSAPTEDAEDLLDKISRGTLSVSVSADSGTVNPGGEVQLYAEVYDGNGDLYSDQSVTWTVTGAAESGTNISGTGLLTADENEAVDTVLTVRAVSTVDENAYDDYAITVISAQSWDDIVEEIEDAELGEDSVWIDGHEWFVLAKDGTKVLLLKSDRTNWGLRAVSIGLPDDWNENYAAYSEYSTWAISGLREYLNTTFLDTLTLLKAHAVETEINAVSIGSLLAGEHDKASHYTTEDTLFLLSVQDMFNGSYSGSTMGQFLCDSSLCYTYGSYEEGSLIKESVRAAIGNFEDTQRVLPTRTSIYYEWDNNNYAPIGFVSHSPRVSSINYTNNGNWAGSRCHVAMWIDLAS